jgi:tRNA threonylcarbamoyladenosine biosynthesis protein TsaE
MSITSDDTNSAVIDCLVPDEAVLTVMARALWPVLRGGLVFHLQGPVGAGKTAFVRQVLRAGGIQGPVRSPTYTLVELYPFSNLYFYHFDLYRFFDPDEWTGAGFDEMFGSGSVAMIEWPEKAGSLLPASDITLQIDHAPQGRHFRAFASTPEGQVCLTAWKQSLPAQLV